MCEKNISISPFLIFKQLLRKITAKINFYDWVTGTANIDKNQILIQLSNADVTAVVNC